ncbi:MAG: tRNA-dihydrouridine synthase family protein [Chlorobi bacterium]|nr:tRNA-dihydrouridine synthase family protein [Chlorobiota bacterium]
MKLSLAPIQSYTTVFYRYAHRVTFNTFDKYFTPFFEDDKQGGWEPVLQPELDTKINDTSILIPQIAANEPEFLIRSAEKFAELGYKEINLNMGCPFPMLVKRQKGAGLVAEPKLLENILNNFFKKTPDVKLSVKIRLGVNSPDEWQNIIPVLNDYPLTEVIVHPRTAKQKYSGEVNWDEFEKIIAVCKHPVTANGDINSKETYLDLQNRFPGVSSWMTGRGTLINPFLPGEIKGINYSSQDKKELFIKFHDTYLTIVKQHYPVWNHAFNHIRNFWYYPLQNIENGKRLFKKLKKHLIENEYSKWVNKVMNVTQHQD